MKAVVKKTEVIDKQIDTDNISKESSHNYIHSIHSLDVLTIDLGSMNDTSQLSVTYENTISQKKIMIFPLRMQYL